MQHTCGVARAVGATGGYALMWLNAPLPSSLLLLMVEGVATLL